MDYVFLCYSTYVGGSSLHSQSPEDPVFNSANIIPSPFRPHIIATTPLEWGWIGGKSLQSPATALLNQLTRTYKIQSDLSPPKAWQCSQPWLAHLFLNMIFLFSEEAVAFQYGFSCIFPCLPVEKCSVQENRGISFTPCHSALPCSLTSSYTTRLVIHSLVAKIQDTTVSSQLGKLITSANFL